MSVQIKSRNAAAWAQKWVPRAKEHMRIEYDRDDQIIQDKIAMAADEVEGYSETKIIAAEMVWRPSYHNWLGGPQLQSLWYAPGREWSVPAYDDLVGYDGLGGYSVPSSIAPIASFRAMIDGEDRSPIWRLVGDVSPDALGRSFFVRAPGLVEGWTEPNDARWLFHCKVGFEDPDTTPPRIVDVVLRLAAHLYENREMLTGQANIAPDYQGALGLLWRARC